MGPAISWLFWTLVLTLLALLLPMMVLSLALYHAVVLKAAHERWPVISEAVRYVERQDRAQRDRYVRENLDAMAEKVGDLQARLLRLEAVGERVAGMAGVKPEELKRMEAPAQGAPGGRGSTLNVRRRTFNAQVGRPAVPPGQPAHAVRKASMSCGKSSL